ncbi:hypothetical protein [Nocardia gipuzkoensis]|uniref:hypothetical protein n=1 Tax=Nocardia gipuzkoensis TaxID=2749991 RepID=UPI00237D486C|nr:hypothetical protein [Nocardia gipuzkoensis]MDE1672693.1 hypothetical protein [Nocardia gipuzkoensis]
MTSRQLVLPDKYAIRIGVSVDGNTDVSIVDERGQVCLNDVVPRSPGHVACAVHRVEALPDPALRTCAQELIDRFDHSVVDVHAILAGIPDHDALINRLTDSIPGLIVRPRLNRDKLTLTITLNADRAAAGALLSLYATWRASMSPSRPGLGISTDIADSGALTIELTDTWFLRFLLWYRAHGDGPRVSTPERICGCGCQRVISAGRDYAPGHHQRAVADAADRMFAGSIKQLLDYVERMARTHGVPDPLTGVLRHYPPRLVDLVDTWDIG